MKFINIALLSIAILFTSLSGAFGALRATDMGENGLTEHQEERELSSRSHRRRRYGMGRGKGTSKSKSKSKSARYWDDRGFLPGHIEPLPGINCIPVPPGFGGGRSGSKGKGKGASKSKSKSGRRYRGGRGGRRRWRTTRSSRRELKKGYGMMHHQKMMHQRPLPWCPTFAPTFLPSLTLFPSDTWWPTWTPLPTVTPFPSFTPFPTGDFFPDPENPIEPVPPIPENPIEPEPENPIEPEPENPIEPGTGAPVETPPGTERILVESTLEYGFFDGVEIREPTQEELDGLMDSTSQFYEELLRAAYPNLDSFEAVLVSSSFDAANTDLPVFIEFDANAFFTEGMHNIRPFLHQSVGSFFHLTSFLEIMYAQEQRSQHQGKSLQY
jgi:hypothetical protein